MPLSNIIANTILGKIYIDTRLNGDILTRPFKGCLSYIENSWTPKDNLDKRLLDAFTRVIVLIVATMALVPTAIVAIVGIAIKWIDLSWRFSQIINKGPMISYSLPLPMEMGSRLGDRLVAYLHAKLLAEKYNIPLYFQPFAGAEFFYFYQTETVHQHPLYFRQVVHLKTGAAIEALMKKTNKAASVLYDVPYFPLSQVETGGPYCSYFSCAIDWAGSKPRVKELLKVVAPHQLISIPEGSLSIALHIRTGGTYDTKDTSTMLPTKLPPLSYSIGELQRILSDQTLHQDRPIFIHIFTDDESPKKLYETLKQAVTHPKIIWSYDEHSQLASDVANMTRFNCLIRPDSNLSGILTKIAEFSLQVSPTHFVVDRNWKQITIDQVSLLYNDSTRKEEVKKSTKYTLPVVKLFLRPSLFYRWFHRYFVGVDSHGQLP